MCSVWRGRYVVCVEEGCVVCVDEGCAIFVEVVSCVGGRMCCMCLRRCVVWYGGESCECFEGVCVICLWRGV